ncbi:unnamed protein product [Amoebophrya sp. A120]|nr:unnamed protein product [Amoebophrya sp. A120]|eukprot:GSA120T00001859001.1
MASKLKKLRAAAGVNETGEAEQLLPGLAKRPGVGNYKTAGGGHNSKIMKVMADIEKDLIEYLEDLDTIAANIDTLAHDVRRVATTKEEGQKVKEMQMQLDQSKQYNAKVKSCLEDLENLAHGKKSHTLSSAEKDYCNTILETMSKKFKDCVKKSLAAQSNFETATRSRLQKGLQMMFPDASKEEVSELISGDPKQIQGLLQKQYTKAGSQGDRQLHDQLSTMQDNHDAMLELEQSVLELNELFFYLSALVEKQARTLESIEAHVDKTDEYIGEGVESLERAETLQRSYESKRQCLKAVLCWGGIVGIIVLCVILFFCVIKPACLEGGGGSFLQLGGGGSFLQRSDSNQGSLLFSNPKKLRFPQPRQ